MAKGTLTAKLKPASKEPETPRSTPPAPPAGAKGINLQDVFLNHLRREKLPVTIQLAVMSMIFAFAIGIPMGILAAVKKNTVIDFLANIVALCGLSVPNFWLGIMLILLVSVKLHWLSQERNVV